MNTIDYRLFCEENGLTGASLQPALTDVNIHDALPELFIPLDINALPFVPTEHYTMPTEGSTNCVAPFPHVGGVRTGDGQLAQTHTYTPYDWRTVASEEGRSQGLTGAPLQPAQTDVYPSPSSQGSVLDVFMSMRKYAKSAFLPLKQEPSRLFENGLHTKTIKVQARASAAFRGSLHVASSVTRPASLARDAPISYLLLTKNANHHAKEDHFTSLSIPFNDQGEVCFTFYVRPMYVACKSGRPRVALIVRLLDEEGATVGCQRVEGWVRARKAKNAKKAAAR